MRHLKLLPGTMILMLASILSINPVSAQQTPGSTTGETQNQQIDTNTPQTPTRTNTQPVTTPTQTEGQSVPSTPTQTESQSAPSSTDTNAINTVTGTVKSIEGQVVTLAMADGMTKEMRVSNADLQRLNLREGMEISATVDAQSVASNITVAQSSTTPTGTEATGSQSGTTTTTESTTSTPVSETDDTSETPTTSTENPSTEPAATNRPVRALW